MIFIRTHWFYSVWWEYWDNGSQCWKFNSTDLTDFEDALSHYDYLRAQAPGQFRNIRMVKRPVGAPRDTRFVQP